MCDLKGSLSHSEDQGVGRASCRFQGIVQRSRRSSALDMGVRLHGLGAAGSSRASKRVCALMEKTLDGSDNFLMKIARQKAVKSSELSCPFDYAPSLRRQYAYRQG